MEQFLAQEFGGGLRHLGILAPIIVLGPGVEMKMNNGRFGALAREGAFDEERAGIAGPAAIRRMQHKLNVPQIHADVLENTAGVGLVFLVPDDETNLFAGGNFPDHLAIDPRDDLEFAGPVAGVVGPAEPRGFMGFPFGGHGVPEVGGDVSNGGFHGRHKISAAA